MMSLSWVANIEMIELSLRFISSPFLNFILSILLSFFIKSIIVILSSLFAIFITKFVPIVLNVISSFDIFSPNFIVSSPFVS